MTEREARTELLDALGDGFLGAGARPRFPEIPRWARVANVPDIPLPAVPELRAHRIAGPLAVDGRLAEHDWAAADWSPPFGTIASGERAGLGTLIPELVSPGTGHRVTVQAYRAHHPHRDPVADARMAAQFPGSSEWLGTTLSAMGTGNVQDPERWVRLELAG